MLTRKNTQCFSSFPSPHIHLGFVRLCLVSTTTTTTTYISIYYDFSQCYIKHLISIYVLNKIQKQLFQNFYVKCIVFSVCCCRINCISQMPPSPDNIWLPINRIISILKCQTTFPAIIVVRLFVRLFHCLFHCFLWYIESKKCVFQLLAS